MDVSMLSERVEPLLRHMEREGYSRHKIGMTMADVHWLERNGSGYGTFEDALDARCAETGCPRVRAARATSFRILKRFLLDGGLPEYGSRTPPRPKGAYHELPVHMRDVADRCRRSALADGLAESTAAVRVSAPSRFLLAMHEAGRRSLADVTERDVLDYLTTADGTPRFSGRVVNALARVLSSDLGPHSAEAARIAALIPRSRAVRRNVQFLTEDECERVLETLASHGVSRLDRAIVTTPCHTGLRAGDVAGLRLGDVDWSRDEAMGGASAGPARAPAWPYRQTARCRMSPSRATTGGAAPRYRGRHESGKSLHVRGCPGQQVCVPCVADDRGDVFATVMGRAHGGAELIERSLEGG